MVRIIVVLVAAISLSLAFIGCGFVWNGNDVEVVQEPDGSISLGNGLIGFNVRELGTPAQAPGFTKQPQARIVGVTVRSVYNVRVPFRVMAISNPYLSRDRYHWVVGYPDDPVGKAKKRPLGANSLLWIENAPSAEIPATVDDLKGSLLPGDFVKVEFWIEGVYHYGSFFFRPSSDRPNVNKSVMPPLPAPTSEEALKATITPMPQPQEEGPVEEDDTPR